MIRLNPGEKVSEERLRKASLTGTIDIQFEIGLKELVGLQDLEQWFRSTCLPVDLFHPLVFRVVGGYSTEQENISGTVVIVATVCDVFLDNECPDCGEKVPADAVNGSACQNCGHVFTMPNYVTMLLREYIEQHLDIYMVCLNDDNPRYMDVGKDHLMLAGVDDINKGSFRLDSLVSVACANNFVHCKAVDGSLSILKFVDSNGKQVVRSPLRVGHK